MTHECPNPTCDRQVPSEFFACRRHWFFLPLDLRRAVWATAGSVGPVRERVVADCMDYYIAHPDPQAKTRRTT
jgi:hypothetical protein